MLQQLHENPNKVPSPSHNDMMKMLADSWELLNIDSLAALKNSFVTNAFDASEDYLVSDKLFDIIGNQMIEFRNDLLKSKPPATLQDLVQTMRENKTKA